ncbi:hypothetical protein B0I35DRAFT_143559 [Stachybotrys elegans]|uniref:protein-histidine N-methyltransferase n=1 Tax=Stachybotrys elegans TaxID=80388 RepID=A0A8K0WXB8_9HYPO|nr:hypothetical protein B0I35DRAFT_143559 [Stachybotrys elegans]
MAFSFGFSGEDIDAENDASPQTTIAPPPNPAAAASAFPVAGKPQLPATQHALPDLLATLPSKIAYSCLDVHLDDGSTIQLPRRELWDVRVQLMAEDEGGDAAEGLGTHDVKTGVYEGGFKSWESSVDLVKVLAADSTLSARRSAPLRVIELGCGTALPSLALFQWTMPMETRARGPTSFILADYNPTVLQLVTLPNFVLSWALHHRNSSDLQEAWMIEGELELSPEILAAFQEFLADHSINLCFLSGGWSPEFVELLYKLPSTAGTPPNTVLLGAETIYSPFALQAFTETIFRILEREQSVTEAEAAAYVAAKRLYFGVGGSLDDFIEKAQSKGGLIRQLREETEGVRRGVVLCRLQPNQEPVVNTAA